jgi:hypothetical protein
MSNNLFNDINNSDVLFINILNAMYNDNLRIIHNLIDQNNEIRHQLINTFNNRRNNNSNINSNTNAHSYVNQSNNNRGNYPRNRQRVNNNNMANNVSNNRIIINDIPYIIEDIQYLTPFNNNQLENQNLNTNRRNISLSSEFNRLLNSFLEPINILPTQLQIEQSTRNMIYGEIENSTNNSCPISLENFTETSEVTMIIPCRHVFNSESLMSWFNTSTRCPVCRYDIRTYNPNTSPNNNSTTTNNTNNINNNYNNDNNNNNDTNDNNNNNDNNDNNDNNATVTPTPTRFHTPLQSPSVTPVQQQIPNPNVNGTFFNTNIASNRNAIRNINEHAFALLDNLFLEGLESLQDISGNTTFDNFQPFYTYFSHNTR